MLIGVDKDNVLSDFNRSFLEYYNNKHKTSYKLDDVHTSEPWDFFQISKRTVLKEYILFELKTNFFMDIPPVDGSVESVQKLRDKGYDLAVVSTTPKIFSGRTKSWIKRWFGDNFREIHLISSLPTLRGFFGNYSRHDWKYKKYLELGADFIIEDSFDTANKCSVRGIKKFLLDYPWNRNQVGDESPNLLRVGCWKEIVDRL